MVDKRALFITLLFFSSIVGLIYVRPVASVDDRVRKIYPSKQIVNFTLGYDGALAGSFWLNFLVYAGLCDQGADVAPTYNSGGNLTEILNNSLAPSRCHLSWSYQMLDVMSDLSPRFYSIYKQGAELLSVAVDDREGARRILEKGLSKFPKSQELNFIAGYHYLYEIQDAEKAIERLQTSVENGGPDWIPALIAGIYTEIGKAALAKKFLEDFLQTNPSEYGRERARIRLEMINKKLGL